MTTNIKSKQLDILLNEFQLLSKTTLTQLQLVSKLMQDNTIEPLYDEVEANEIIIDRLEIKIREEVVFTIFKFNPVAADLRQIIAYQDLTTNLERVGDMLLNIIHCLKVTDFKANDLDGIRKTLIKMMGYATEMTRDAILAFSNHDAQVAYNVIKEDDKVDELFHQLKVTLQDKYSDKQLNKEDVKNIINISAISQNLERIGDSATNIAEAAIYIADGKDIRHGNKN